MLTKNDIKFINSLKRKKYRKEHKLFIAEGTKVIEELFNSYFQVKWLFCNKDGFDYFSTKVKNKTTITTVSDKELSRISNFKTPQKALALVKIPQNKLEIDNLKNKLSLFLDDVNDPGNLGTIIRVAGWFGIENIFCSPDTVDVYNPKVIQASMGAIAGVNIFYESKTVFFNEINRKTDLKIYGTLLDGENIYSKNLSQSGIIILGSESHGISPEVQEFITDKLHIPSFAHKKQGVESLNVAIAASIVCSEFRRSVPVKG